MADSRAPSARTATAGLLLVVAGLAFWVLYGYQSGRERASYAEGGAPPAYVHVTGGHKYWISIAGGVGREAGLGVAASALHCTAASPGAAAGTLVIVPENADTKATNQIASFTAGQSGDLHIECNGIGTVYVDDADGNLDYAGLWLVLATIALTVGLPLALARFVMRRAAPDDDPARPDRDQPLPDDGPAQVDVAGSGHAP